MGKDQTQYLFAEADRGVTVEKDGQRRCMGCMELYSAEYELCPHCGYQIDEKVENALHMYPGTVLKEKYVVGKVLGYGGFGVTYLAWDTLLHIKVAIKEYLPSEFSTRSAGQTQITVFSGEKSKQFSDGLDKFIDEAKRLAVFRSEPGIVKIFDSFEENGTAYIVMEYLEGETLATFLEREKSVPAEEAIKMLMPIIESLNKVHDEGIIHRDIAPDNIFLTTRGDVKLIDFGASRYATTSRSRSLTVIIKPGYSAEEQYRSHSSQGPHTDVYSIGAVLYRMVTGQNPPDAMERRAEFEKNKNDILVPVSKIKKGVSKKIENSILNAMNVRIEDRTPDMISLAGELLSEEPVSRRRSGLKKIDPLTWPLWAKIGVPLGIIALIVLSVLFVFGIIGPRSTLRTDFNVPDGHTLIPNVVAHELEDAQKTLETNNLQWRIKDRKQSEVIENGLVLMQDPDALNVAPIGSYIDIIISAGMGSAFVEDYAGYLYEDAKKALEDLGFVVEKKEKRNPAYGEGVVFDQSILEESAEKGTEIILYVSRGQKVDPTVEVTVPNIIGKTFDDARELLANSNLTIVKNVNVAYDAKKPIGAIVSQTPLYGFIVHEGDKITVTINAGVKKVRVPYVTDITEEQAINELEALGLVANVVYEKNQYYAKGTVFGQSVSADKEAAVGSTVTLKVSSGYTIKVPNVFAMEMSAAQETLRQSGFASSVEQFKPSSLIKNGYVLSQSVAAGSEVDSDTIIYLTVSSGAATQATTKSTTKENTISTTARENTITTSHLNTEALTVERSTTKPTTTQANTTTNVQNSETTRGTCGNNLTWTLDKSTGVLEISGYGPMEEFTSANKVPWYSERSYIRKATIHDDVTSIGSYAFYDCDNFVNLTIDSGIKSIGASAFYGCDNVETVKINDSVTSLGDRAFGNCVKLSNVTLSKNLRRIEEHTFYNCYSLKSIEIPYGVTLIDDWAFGHCTSLSSVTIPNSVTSIGEYAFCECALKSVKIPQSVTYMHSYVFFECTKLTDIYYSGTKSEWYDIDIYATLTDGTGVYHLVIWTHNTTIHFNS